jgi:hypothetical protein
MVCSSNTPCALCAITTALTSVEDIMQLDLGSHVPASDDQNIGRIDRIILESCTMTIRDFVVHQGTFFG